MCYFGYTFEQLLAKNEKDKYIKSLIQNLDILVDGPFLLEERSLGIRFRGSGNRRIIDVHNSLINGKAVTIEI